MSRSSVMFGPKIMSRSSVMFGLGLGVVHGLALGKVTGLYRHAVKGLSADTLQTVQVATGETFPDDRRFALLKAIHEPNFDPLDPGWIHKENFLCVFTDPQLMAKYRASYSMQIIVPHNNKECLDGFPHGTPSDRLLTVGEGNGGKYLTLYERSTDTKVLGPLDLSTELGRQELANFFSEQAGIPLICVTADNHQFGNTSSGWKQKKDTRTIHIVTESTVNALQAAIGNDQITLSPTRFRPNLVLQGDDLKPFSEFDWIGKTIQCGPTLRLQVISKTVRCKGVSLDPIQPDLPEIDVPGLLVKHFPEHGPYLGVYAVVENGGEVTMGDDVFLL